MKPEDSYKLFMSVVLGRYSCRNFDENREVSRQYVEEVVEAARMAPSAVNLQPWTFVAVTSPEIRECILEKSRPAFLKAPVLLVACGHHDKAWHRRDDNKDHTDIDVAIAVEHICLAATTLGLSTCWVCSFDVEATKKALNLPDQIEPIALIPLGYSSDGTIPEKKRKTMTEILKWEKF